MTSCPPSTSALRLGTAKSGDPMKTIRKTVRPEPVEGLSFYFAPPKEKGRASTSSARTVWGTNMASQEIEALSQALARLPGLGPRSARRAVLHLMKKREVALQPLLA